MIEAPPVVSVAPPVQVSKPNLSPYRARAILSVAAFAVAQTFLAVPEEKGLRSENPEVISSETVEKSGPVVAFKALTGALEPTLRFAGPGPKRDERSEGRKRLSVSAQFAEPGFLLRPPLLVS